MQAGDCRFARLIARALGQRLFGVALAGADTLLVRQARDSACPTSIHEGLAFPALRFAPTFD